MKKLIFLLVFFQVSYYSFGQGLRVEYSAEVNPNSAFSRSLETEKDKSTKFYINKIIDDIESILPQLKFTLTADHNSYRLNYNEPMAIGETSEFLIRMAASAAIDGESIYCDLKNKVSYYIPNSLSIIRKVSLEEIEWQVTRENKEILGLTCYRAVASLADPGAEYGMSTPVEAWFSPELNFRGGPTPYASLPGTILELEMPNVRFIATKIETGEITVAGFENEDKKILSHQEFVHYYENWNKQQN